MTLLQDGIPQEDGIGLDVDNNSDDNVKSTSSVRFVASVRALDRRAKLAALQQQKEFAQKQRELEVARMETEFRLQQLKLDRQVAVAQAELDIYEQDSDPEVTFPKLDFVRSRSA